MRCSEYAFEESTAGWQRLLGGGTTGQRALSKRVVNEEIVQDSAPDLNSYGRWARGIDIRAAADAGAAMAVVLKEHLGTNQICIHRRRRARAPERGCERGPPPVARLSGG